ncbi:helix-turn-helix domain-containing protein [Corynebacterium urealyticum]|uniref:helix-turn-helix domain-containing protein n=1 Tax=Corynebacterium urealyticum TaxID=43771 RepID=UPI0011D18E00|nr:helix-turn-helix transcriptional regulator [Corynebacterium urealyticum]
MVWSAHCYPRKHLGISQERLAHNAGLSVSSLVQAELGKMPLNLKRMPGIARELQ